MTHIETMIRVIDAWDSTPLPKNKDGRLWQMMEEMRQALEESLVNHIPDATKMVSGVKDSLTTQQEQGEPVAWMQDSVELYVQEEKDENRGYVIPLYTTPYVPEGRQQRTAAEGEDTRRAWVKPHEWVRGECVKCGASIEQEYLKPLTDEQKIALCKQFPDSLTFDAISAIEAAHGIKENT